MQNKVPDAFPDFLFSLVVLSIAGHRIHFNGRHIAAFVKDGRNRLNHLIRPMIGKLKCEEKVKKRTSRACISSSDRTRQEQED